MDSVQWRATRILAKTCAKFSVVPMPPDPVGLPKTTSAWELPTSSLEAACAVRDPLPYGEGCRNGRSLRSSGEDVCVGLSLYCSRCRPVFADWCAGSDRLSVVTAVITPSIAHFR